MTSRPRHPLSVAAWTLLAAAALLASCASRATRRRAPAGNTTAPGLHGASLSMDGTEREFSYYVPDRSTDAPAPVVIYLHGHGDSMRHILGEGRVPSASSIWMDVAEREDFLVFYPLGLKGDGRRGKTGWNDYRVDAAGNPTGDDVGFVARLIEFAASELGADRDRVYITGMSNGGHMAMRVAMEMPERIAAVAPVVALLPERRSVPPPSQPVPILMMHGTDDPIAPFEGGAMGGNRGNVLSARETQRLWVEWNQMDSVNPRVTQLPDADPSDGSTMTARSWASAEQSGAVVAYEMRGAGHTEPSIGATMPRWLQRVQGNQNQDVEMAEACWDFFRSRSR